MGMSRLEYLRRITNVLVVFIIFLLCILGFIALVKIFFFTDDSFLSREKGPYHNTMDLKDDQNSGLIPLSHENDNIKHESITSNFESEQYECEGSCVCVSDVSERRASAITIGKSIKYVVFAFASIIATQKAKRYFDEECRKRITSSSSSSNDNDFSFPSFSRMRSIIDDCKRIEASDKISDEMKKDLEWMKKCHTFSCKGVCLELPEEQYLNELIAPTNLKKRALEESKLFGCENIEMMSEIKVEIPTYEFIEKYKNEFNKEPINHENIAKRVFILDYLKETCRKNSIKQIVLDGKQSKGEIGLCVGHYSKFSNPTVTCVETKDD